MSSKEQKPSKKAVKEKQKKAIEDNTFGLKNKNKSKKVQQFINRVEKSVKHSGNGLELEKARELKKEAKLMKQIQEEELRQLLASALTNQPGMKKSKANATVEQLGLATTNKEVSEFLEQLSSDSDEESEDESQYNIVKDNWDDDAPANSSGGVEIFREKTIEDIIEEQRAKLSAEGKKGTPVTEESFAKWRAEKIVKKQAEAEARLKSEQTKKKGGKGLSVLSGKELFNYNASLFIDDESAFDTSNDQTINAEMKALKEREEQQILEEYERAQAEQMRLVEIQKAELEAKKYIDEEKRRKAMAADRKTFVFNGIVINEIVFMEEDEEDLELFTDEPFVPDTTKAISSSQEEEMIRLLNNLSLKEQELQALTKRARVLAGIAGHNNQEEDDDDEEEGDDEEGDEEEGEEEGEEDDDAES